MTAINIGLIVLALACIIVLEIQMKECIKALAEQDERHSKERDRLMDRIQAPTLREYKAVVAEPKPRPLKAPDEVITPL